MSTNLPIAGTMRLGAWGRKFSPAEAANFLQACADAGIRDLDLADIYGDYTTNALIGDAFKLSPRLRDHFRLILKIGIVGKGHPDRRVSIHHYDGSPTYLKTALDRELKALGVEQIHTLMLHRYDPMTRFDDLSEWIQTLLESETIQKFGVSNFSGNQLKHACDFLPISANQISLSLGDLTVLENGGLDDFRSRGIAIQAWSPLGGGQLIGAKADREIMTTLAQMSKTSRLSPAQLCLKWLASVPNVRPVLGTGRAERMEDAVAAIKAPMDREDWYKLFVAARGQDMP